MGKEILSKRAVSYGKVKKNRNYSSISYLSRDQLLSVLRQHSSAIKYSAFILHDKDKWTDEDEKINKDYKAGTYKEKHYHLILLLNYPYPESSVNSWFKGFYDNEGKQINTIVQVCNMPSSVYRYFVHKDHPDKYQYDQKDIVSSDPLYFSLDDDEDEPDSSFSALEYFLNSGSAFQTARKFGRDFIIHYSSYKALYEDIAYYPRSYTPKIYNPEGNEGANIDKNYNKR